MYPSSTKTLAGQLAAKRLPWRAYMEGMGERPGAESGGADGDCGHPALGTADPTSAATPPAGQTYATYRNPFVYFSSLTGAPACEADDVGINQLSADLATPSRTPSFAYIVPDRCHDGSPTPCASGAPAGVRGGRRLLEAGRSQRSSARRPTRKTACWRSPSIRRPPAANSPTPAPAAVSRSSRTCRPPPRASVPKAEARSARCCCRRSSSRRGRQPGTVQPLLAAAHDRGPVRAVPPRLRRAVEGQLLRTVDLLGSPIGLIAGFIGCSFDRALTSHHTGRSAPCRDTGPSCAHFTDRSCQSHPQREEFV